MLEGHVAELLAAHLSRFIKNVTANQLQISLWSGNVVLNNVELRSDALQRVAAYLHGEHSDIDTNDAKETASAAAGVPSGSPDPHGGGSRSSTLSMRMLLAPFTVVKGVIQQLVITVPWASLESEPVKVDVVGVELVLGPLRARPFNAWEEQEREQAIKQQQLERYEKERHHLSSKATKETVGEPSSMMTASTESGHVKSGGETAMASTNLAPGASWFSWLWDFDRLSQIVLRNLRVALQDVSVRYEHDYEGLHPSCASALCVFVKQVELTTTDENFEDGFNKDIVTPLCKRIALLEVVVSTHAIRRSGRDAFGSTREGVDGPVLIAAGERASCAGAYDAYASRWALSQAILRLQTLRLQAKLVPPGCASKNAIVEEMPILTASSTEVSVTTIDGIEVDICFGVVQVLECMWRSYQQSLHCSRYRKRLHLIQPTEGHSAHSRILRQTSESGCAGLLQDHATAWRPSVQQRWRFALRCVLDDVRQHRQIFGLQEQKQCEAVEAMVKFGQLRRVYTEYWKRAKGVTWAPPLSALEEKRLKSMERQLTLWQVIFLRCFSQAQLIAEQEGHIRQQCYIEEARQRSRSGLQGSSGAGGGGTTTPFLWGRLFGSFWGRNPSTSLRSKSLAPIKSPDDLSVTSAPAYKSCCMCDLVAQEWNLGQRFISPQDAPLARPRAPQNPLREMAAENKLYFTLHAVLPTVIMRLDPIYWPLTYDCSVPATPSATPLRRVEQHIVFKLRAAELFYTTIPDYRADRASLSFFLGSASVTFEGTLRSVLLQSADQCKEDYVVVKRNSKRTHIRVWVAPQVVVCQPTHEWTWWCTEVSAFVQWIQAVQQAFYVSGATEATSCAVPVCMGNAQSDGHGNHSTGAQMVGSSSDTSSRGGQSTHTETRTTIVPATSAPLVLNVTIQAIDFCVPLFARDIESSDLEIVNCRPSGFSSTTLLGSLPGTMPSDSYSKCGEWQHQFSTEIASIDGDSGSRRTQAEGDMHGSGATPAVLRLRKTDGIRCFEVEGSTNGEEYTNSFCGSPGGSLNMFTHVAQERCLLKSESCLVLSVSTTRLWATLPQAEHCGCSGNEYSLCIGDQRKAVRLFCQSGYRAHTPSPSGQLELLSFVAGEVRVNPTELTVLLNKGIDAVADPSAFALVNDALLKPTVLAGADAKGQTLRALTAELQQAESRWSGKRGAAVPWRFTTSTCVELRTDSESLPVLREVPLDCARHILSTLYSPLSIAPNSVTTIVDAMPRSERATGVFGRRVFTVGVGVARLLIRSEANVDLGELVLVAPEHLPSATAPYREALSALGEEEPRAMELIWNFSADERHGIELSRNDPLPHCPVREKVCPAFFLSIPDITMTTTAGRKLLTIENLTLVQTCRAPRKPEVALTIQTVFAFFDVVLLELLRVLMGTMCTMRPIKLSSEGTVYAPKGASRSEIASLHSLQSGFLGMHTVSLGVQTARIQTPFSTDDIVDAPYVEVTTTIEDVLCTLEPSLGGTGIDGKHVHFQLSLSEAMQLVDYIGGEPEERHLISAYPWASCTGDGTANPLRCVADLTIPGTCVGNTGTHTLAQRGFPSSTECRLALMGGALHVYCPFLYFYAAAMKRDERIVRLCELARSPLLSHGYTHAPYVEEHPRSPRVYDGAGAPLEAAAQLAFSLEVTISDLDAVLATDASVPIDMTKHSTFSVVHIEKVVCGLQRTRLDAPGASTTLETWTHASIDTNRMQLLDFSSLSRDVCLPDVRVRAKTGVLLVPKEDLTGYVYQRSAPDDWSFLVELHPSSASGSHRAEYLHDAASSTGSQSSDITIHMSAWQCHMLARFFLYNVAQLPIDSTARTPKVGGGYPLHGSKGLPPDTLPKGQDNLLSSSRQEAEAPSNQQSTRMPSVTLLLTIPAVSIVIDGDDYGSPHRSAHQPTMSRPSEGEESELVTDAVPPPLLLSTTRIRYEAGLRRGGHLYSAVGGCWSTSPVKNGQLSGLELVAREEAVENSIGDVDVASTTRTHVLLTIDLVGLALLEQRAGQVAGEINHDAREGTASVKIAAAIRHAHFRVSHIKWWLLLYRTFAGVCSRQGCFKSTAARTPVKGGSTSTSARVDEVNQAESEEYSEQSSSALVDQLGPSWGGYMGGDKASWLTQRGDLASRQRGLRRLHGTVEISHTEVSFFTIVCANGNQQPLCRLAVPEARLTASPLPVLQEGGGKHLNNAECFYDKFVLQVPHCPELQLLCVSGEADGAAWESKILSEHSYVSVLRPQTAETSSTASVSPDVKSSSWKKDASETVTHASKLPWSSAYSSESCISLSLLCSSAAGGLKSYRYGRCYQVTDLALHRAGVLHVRLQRLLLDIPAVPTFFLARDVLRQVREWESIQGMKLPTRAAQRDGRDAESLKLTYMDIEGELTDIGVRVFAEAAPLREPTVSADADSDPVFWSISILSARLITSVQLQNVLTSTRMPASLFDDGLGRGSRLQIWHMVPQLATQGVVFSTNSDTQAWWRIPDVRVKVSLPLTRRIICVRGKGATGSGDELEPFSSVDDLTQRLRHRSATNVFLMEPTAVTALEGLDYHVSASLHVDVGAEGNGAGGTEPERKSAPVQVSLSIIFILVSSAARLAALWRQTRQVGPPGMAAAGNVDPTSRYARWQLHGAQQRHGLITWYEFEVDLCGHRVEFVMDTAAAIVGDKTAFSLKHDCVMCISVDSAISVQAERELIQEAVKQTTFLDTTPSDALYNGKKTEWCGRVDDASAAAEATRTLFHVRTASLQVQDGAGNLLLHVLPVTPSDMADAMVADYTPAEARLDVNVGRIMMHGSSLTAASIVCWWKAYRALKRKWESAAVSMRTSSACPQEANSSSEPAMGMDDGWKRRWSQHINAVVRHAELVLAPAARVCAEGVHIAFSPKNVDVDLDDTAATLELHCEEICMYSILPQPKASYGTVPIVLARTVAPVLVVTHAQQKPLFLQYRTSLLSITNGDGHSWAMCVFRIAKMVKGTVTAVAAYADLTPLHGCASNPSAGGTAASWVAWIPRGEVDIHNAELLCFAPHSKRTCSAMPVVCLAARQAALRCVDLESRIDPGSGDTIASIRLDVCALLSATYSSGLATDVKAHPLLEEVKTTFIVSSSSPSASYPHEVTLSATAGTEQNAISLHVPTDCTFENTVSALWLLARQKVPRRYAQARETKNSVLSGAKNVRGAGVLWHVRADVARVRVHCSVEGGTSTSFSQQRRLNLCSIAVDDVHAELHTHHGGNERSDRRPHIEVCVGSVVGETVFAEAEEMSLTFLEIRPLVETSSDRSSSTTPAIGGTASTCSSKSAGFSVLQRSFSLSTGEEAHRSEGQHPLSDNAAALVIRLHALRAHPSMTFLKLLMERVLRPCATGVLTASAEASGSHILDGLEDIVIHGRSGAAVPPASGVLNRHAGVVQVIEVATDWNLDDDLRLGGEGGFQLHFCGTAGRSVITVRGGCVNGGKAEGRVPTLSLSFPVGANGEVCPAIRVDPDLTVRFENVRVVLGEGAHAARRGGCVLEAFLELGERSLCLLTPLTVTVDASPSTVDTNAQMEETAASVFGGDVGATAHATVLPKLHTSSMWAVSVMFSVDIAVGFDVSLTAGARRLAATGAVKGRYRLEEKGKAEMTLRSEREGECTISLYTCTSESGPLTDNPVVVTAQVCFEAAENQHRLVMCGGSTLWRLPLGHAHVLIELCRLTQRVLCQTPFPSPEQGLWQAPAGSDMLPHGLTRRATKLDVRADVPSWSLILSSDTGRALAMLRVERAQLHCSTDMKLADVALNAEATVSLRDSIELDDGPREDQGATMRHVAKELNIASAQAGMAARLLFSAQPHLSLSLTRFSPGCRSLSVSVQADSVMATLPLVTILRLLRTSAREMDTGKRVFCNDSGVEMEVAEWAPPAAASLSSIRRWRLAASPAQLLRTSIPTSCKALTLKPVTTPVGNVPSATGEKGDKSGGRASVNIEDLGEHAVCLVSLPGYASALGALDLVVRKSILDNLVVVHLTSSVVLANVFYAGNEDESGATPVAGGIVSVSARDAQLAVPPRSARYVPLPILRECLTLELDGCAYAPVAKVLTWAMMADAMTLLGDQASSDNADSGSVPGKGGSASVKSGANAGFMLYGNLNAHRKDSVENDTAHSETLCSPFLCNRVRALDAFTLSFPMLLSPVSPTPGKRLCSKGAVGSDNDATFSSSHASQSEVAASHTGETARRGRVVQLTWRRRRLRLAAPLFTGRLPPSEYTVAVEPVWTLWNWTGCRLRLRLRTSRDGGPSSPVKAPQGTLPSPPSLVTGSSCSSDVLAAAELENGACFQWTPTTPDVLSGAVFAFFQLMVPSLPDRSTVLPKSPHALQWWSFAAPISFQEPPPLYIRLQQGSDTTLGAVRIEQHGPSSVVVRCAALLRSALAQPVFLRDAEQQRPLLGAGAQGCVMPQQQVPLFYSEHVTTLALHADRVGFRVAANPLTSTEARAASLQESNAFYLKTPMATTLLSVGEQAHCTHFYAVSAVFDAKLERSVDTPQGKGETHLEEKCVPTEALSCLWTPPPPTVVQLRSLCRIRNTHLHRTLLAMPFDEAASVGAEGRTQSPSFVMLIPPGEERELGHFPAHPREPEMQFCYSTVGGRAPAHAWSPPVRLLSLATSTQPLVLKHTCVRRNLPGLENDAESEEPYFIMNSVRRRMAATDALVPEHFRCLKVQSSMTSESLCVSVGLQAAPPLRIVNRLNTSLQFSESGLTRGSDLGFSSVRRGTVTTTLCSCAPRPLSYMVAAESMGYGCWEVPVLELPGIRVTLNSNVRKGFTVSQDVDLLRCAALPSSGTRVGNTDAYVYVSLDHRLRQYTVTLAPSRQLEGRMLVQPRRLTQLEVYVRSCTVYVAAITLPTTGSFSRKSLIARSARGRLRLRRSSRNDECANRDTVPLVAIDEDVLTFLEEEELDVVLVRLLGFYGSASMTERHVIGSASLALLEVVECTTVEAMYPVILRLGPRAGNAVETTEAPTTTAEPDADAERRTVNSPVLPECIEETSTLALSKSVPYFKNPSWFALEVQLTRPGQASVTDGVVMIPVPQFRVTIPPIALRADDDILFTLRSTAERLSEEWAAATPGELGSYATEQRDCLATTRKSVVADSTTQWSPLTYNILVYCLQVSPIVAEVTYTRCGHRHYNPFKGLAPIAEHLIPSVEDLPVSLRAVRLQEVELRWSHSLLDIAKSYLWPLYRTQLLLQSYKVLGSLDALGNPRALLGSWSRGVWELVTNSSGQSRWTCTREFLRTTSSSTLHSVGVLARSIGNLAGTTPTTWGPRLSTDRSSSCFSGNVTLSTPECRGVLGEVLQEVGGGISDAVTKPIRGAREGGVSGFLIGIAAGVAGLAGRPVFGFFRGVSVTSEFYARLLGGLSELTEYEARHLGLERNYLLESRCANSAQVPVPTKVVEKQGSSTSTTTHVNCVSRESFPMSRYILTHAMYNQICADVPSRRRDNEASVRLPVNRVGVYNTALRTPYGALRTFLSPTEFRDALSCALTAMLSSKIICLLALNSTVGSSRGAADDDKGNSRASDQLDRGEGYAAQARLSREYQRASYIKALLGVEALHTYVTDEVFVRVCSLEEIEASLNATEALQKYSVVLARAMDAASERLLAP